MLFSISHGRPPARKNEIVSGLLDGQYLREKSIPSANTLSKAKDLSDQTETTSTHSERYQAFFLPQKPSMSETFPESSNRRRTLRKSSAPADLERDIIDRTKSSYNPTTNFYNATTSSYNARTTSYRPITSFYNPTIRSQNFTEDFCNFRPAMTGYGFPYSTTFHQYSIPWQPPRTYEPSPVANSREMVQVLTQIVNTPKLEYLRFNGEPMKYGAFMHNFENFLERDNPDESRKLQLLVHHCTGKARAAIESFVSLSNEDGYKVA